MGLGPGRSFPFGEDGGDAGGSDTAAEEAEAEAEAEGEGGGGGGGGGGEPGLLSHLEGCVVQPTLLAVTPLQRHVALILERAEVKSDSPSPSPSPSPEAQPEPSR